MVKLHCKQGMSYDKKYICNLSWKGCTFQVLLFFPEVEILGNLLLETDMVVTRSMCNLYI